MEKRGVFFVTLLTFIFLTGLSSATFTVDLNSSNIYRNYYVGDILNGNIAIQFTNESANSILTTNVGESFTLKQWLDYSGKKIDQDYRCSLSGCKESYKANDTIQNIQISSKETKKIGFLLLGSNVSVKSMSFNLQTNLPNSCSKQYSVNLFNEEKYFIENYISTGNLCGSQKRGCFDSSLETGQYQLANLTNNEYCELISLSPAPAYKLGAIITGPLGPLKENITMKLYDDNFTILYGYCSLPISGEEQQCTINYPINNEKNYRVCVSSNSSNSKYQIKTESKEQKCGVTSTTKNSPSTIDFDIFAQPMEYSASQLLFNEDKFALINKESNLTQVANEYLKNEYNRNCAQGGCIIPLTFVGQDQTISIENAVLVYEADGVVKTLDSLQSIVTDYGVISSNKIILSLDKLNIPIKNKINLLEINLDKKVVAKTNINVSSSQIEINPGFALIGNPTKFSLKTNATILEASWKFSDKPLEVQVGNEVIHSFANAGDYTVEVTAKISAGTTITRTKKVIVGEPKASAEEIVSISQNSINKISASIASLPAWIKPAIQNKIDVNNMNLSLLQIKLELAQAKTNEEYTNIIADVQALNIPGDVSVIKSGKFPLLSSYNSINTDYAKSLIGEENVNSQLQVALTEWLRDNYNAEVETETIGANFVTNTEPIVTKIKIITNPLKQNQAQHYIIFGYPIETMHFLSGYSQKEIDGVTYIPLNEGQQVIEFYIEGDVGINDLATYILPSAAELRREGYSYEVISSQSQKRSNFLFISIIILIVLLAGITIFLQYWYRNNYEKNLFPKNEDLYNIMTFIHNSNKSGLKEGDIRKKLLASGWTREQISYSFGRLKGRILGLFGLPIYSSGQESKVKEEIENRQRQRK